MSREHAPVVPGRAGTRIRRGPALARGRGSRAEVRPTATETARSDGARTGVGPVGARALLTLAAAVLLLAGALLLRSGGGHAKALGLWAGDASGSWRATSLATRTIDSRLILVPHTVTKVATSTGVRLDLTVGPLLPGLNRFELRLAAHGRPLAGVRVLLVARMIGMAMRPLTLTMSEVQPGRYEASGSLAMFGAWQVMVQVDRPGSASLRHQFTVGVDLPKGLLTAPAMLGAPQR